MAIYIVLTVIFLVFGIIFAFNKGDFLIAGLNTSESNQNEYDTKKINRMFAVFSIVVAVVSFIGIFVNKDFYMVGILFPVVVVGVTPLGNIVDIFCDECSVDLPEKNFLFETGLYQFTCDEEYYFSLVLQYKDSGDEYIQLHMDVVYPPSMKYEDFASCEWIEDIDEFKQFVLASEEYSLLRTETIFKVDIYIEET